MALLVPIDLRTRFLGVVDDEPAHGDRLASPMGWLREWQPHPESQEVREVLEDLRKRLSKLKDELESKEKDELEVIF